jgi:uncharacterized protein YdeI (YjbR/CyaY-like superfamily)
MNPELEPYFSSLGLFKPILNNLREIVLSCGLIEEVKWEVPCYTYKGKNIVVLGEFKDNCVLSFFKGSLLNDSEGFLSKPGENSQVFRIIRFKTMDDFNKVEPFLKAYIFEAIEIEKSGVKLPTLDISTIEIPEELTQNFKENEQFKMAFESLTPGRQRAYILFFSAAKNSQTRFDRIEKFKNQIMDGKGMNDCTCGLSRKMPACDGSHKILKLK